MNALSKKRKGKLSEVERILSLVTKKLCWFFPNFFLRYIYLTKLRKSRTEINAYCFTCNLPIFLCSILLKMSLTTKENFVSLSYKVKWNLCTLYKIIASLERRQNFGCAVFDPRSFSLHEKRKA